MANAWHIKSDGSTAAVAPKNGTDFSLEELQGFVGGYIEIVWLEDGNIIVLNEEGKLLGLEINEVATGLFGKDVIVGDVLICPMNMVK